MSESCVETPEAPAWLSKLESQREKLSKARLGHDSGAGAPCNSCGTSIIYDILFLYDMQVSTYLLMMIVYLQGKLYLLHFENFNWMYLNLEFHPTIRKKKK